MTDLTKLADALESMATYNGELLDEEWSSLHEASRILRAAAGVDVAGLMAMARKLAIAEAQCTVLCTSKTGKQSPEYEKADKEYEAALDALESALRLVLAQREWQPIETAPRDGRQLILLLTPSGFPQVAYSNTWWTAGFSVECKPTHWMPLPAAAPQAKEQTA